VLGSPGRVYVASSARLPRLSTRRFVEWAGPGRVHAHNVVGYTVLVTNDGDRTVYGARCTVSIDGVRFSGQSGFGGAMSPGVITELDNGLRIPRRLQILGIEELWMHSWASCTALTTS
jgi:hypothetical protein